MPTPEELQKEFERLRSAALFPLGGDEEAKGRPVNPVLQEAIDDYEPPVEPSVTKSGDGKAVDVKLGGSLRGATIPFRPGVADSGKESGQGDGNGSGSADDLYDPTTIYGMLMRNELVRRRASEDWERNEKANRARTSIAAVADALASLGNLAGTVYGAPNQEQTYQTPFVTEDVKEDRALARKRADALRENEQSLGMLQMKLDAQEAALQAKNEQQLAVQQMITERAVERALARERLEEKKAGWREELEETKHGHRTEEEGQRQEGRETLHQMDNESRERRTSTTAGTSRANELTRSADRKEKLEAQKSGQIGGGGSGRSGSSGGGGGTRRRGNPMGSGGNGNKKRKQNPMD